jgi:hypothetical protein
MRAIASDWLLKNHRPFGIMLFTQASRNQLKVFIIQILE